MYNTLYMEQAIERARKIRAILTDVDGILTDGKVNFFVRDDGKIDEFKSFNTQDGLAVMLCNSTDIVCGIITGRRHPTTVERARNLGYKYMYQGFLTKMGPLNDILKKEGLTPEQVAYIGDDITDMPLLKAVGFAATVPNALDVVKSCAHYVTKRNGGDGIETISDGEDTGFTEVLLSEGEAEKRTEDPGTQFLTMIPILLAVCVIVFAVIFVLRKKRR